MKVRMRRLETSQMTTKHLYYVLGVLVLLIVGMLLGWYLTAGLAGGGIVAALTSWLKKDQKFREEKNKIDKDSDDKEKKVEDEKNKLLQESKEKERKQNTQLDLTPEPDRNDMLDKLAEEFKRKNS